MFDWNDAPDTRPLYACRCGQSAITPTDRCAACETRQNAPQGHQEHLFAPAPEQMRGQLTM